MPVPGSYNLEIMVVVVLPMFLANLCGLREVRVPLCCRLTSFSRGRR